MGKWLGTASKPFLANPKRFCGVSGARFGSVQAKLLVYAVV